MTRKRAIWMTIGGMNAVAILLAFIASNAWFLLLGNVVSTLSIFLSEEVFG